MNVLLALRMFFCIAGIVVWGTSAWKTRYLPSFAFNATVTTLFFLFFLYSIGAIR